MRYLALNEVPAFYRRIVEQPGGATGSRDLCANEKALSGRISEKALPSSPERV